MVALLVGGCAKRVVISDDDLKRITREMYLANAFADYEKIGTDSLDIYSPILARYGYTEQDFFNTLASFSKRKSARLSHIIEGAISSLEGLSEGYARKLRNLRYIDSLAKAECSYEVMFVERIAVSKMKDTTRLHINLPVRDEGEYVVTFNYLIDTLDKNLRLQTDHALYANDTLRTFINRANLTREKRESATMTIKPKKGAVEYRLTLADYASREDEPHITFDSLRIVYLPPTHEALAHMDSVMHFRPALLFNDSVRVYGYLDARAPLVPHDTVWLRIDSLDLARVAELHAGADSLIAEGERVASESQKLLARREKLLTEAEKKWFRNDSLRQVAHEKNLVKAEALVVESDSLILLRDQLAERAEGERLVADSIEMVLWGEVKSVRNESKK